MSQTMVGADQLTQLMQAALADKTAEPAFFRALLEATVYTHTPRADLKPQGPLRLIQFTTREGLTVLPFFSDEAQAYAAAAGAGAAAVVALIGRQLFELTRGATLMLNPNSTSCTLYPEEIAVLLDRGEVAVVEHVTLPEDVPLEFRALEPAPAWLIDPLIALYTQLACVDSAYVVEIRSPDRPQYPGLLIAVAVPPAEAERVARASTTAIQPLCQGREIAVDLTAFAPGQPPDWLQAVGAASFYARAWGQRMIAAPHAVQ